MNAIFACGDVVLRVATPSVDAQASHDLAAFLSAAGVRVVPPRRDEAVVYDGLSVTAWERIPPSEESIDWVGVGAMVRRVHEIDPASIPASVPLPHPAVLPWWNFDAIFSRAGDALDDRAREGLRAAIDRHRGWSDFSPNVVCHGDVHPGNVMVGRDGPVLIDWDLLCLAPAGWDHAPLLTWHDRWGGDARIYESYAAGYGASFTHDEAAVAFAELRLVAATLMRVIAGFDDPHARAEADRRLRYWRGDTDAPPWTAQ
jgi:Ser/Thr protein kinase RdoA (MazF antagonist)